MTLKSLQPHFREAPLPNLRTEERQSIPGNSCQPEPTDSEITFVVQGPVFAKGGATTLACLQSIRHFFPSSPVILSTWVGENSGNLPFDSLVISSDPGAIISDVGSLRMTNNLNRQIVSTRAGLDIVKTPFSVKLRSDAILTGRGFVGFLSAFSWRVSRYALFDKRIIISKEFTRSTKSFVPLAYHPSDLFQFGLTEDLRNFWDITPVTGDRLTEYFLSDAPKSWFKMFDRFRFTTEQYLFLDFLRRSGEEVQLRDFSEMSEIISEISQQYLFNNFLPVEPQLLGVKHAKFHNRAHRSLIRDCIGLREFTSWYVSAVSGEYALRPLGDEAPHLSFALRAERIIREVFKRAPIFRRAYARRYLNR